MSQSKLAQLLKQSGIKQDETEVIELVRGAAAAPVGFDGRAWLNMLGTRLMPELEQALEELRLNFHEALKSSTESTSKLSKVRDYLAKEGLGGILVPRTDEHQSEYVSAYAQRLSWLTGFTGSAGTALVMKEKALIFVDGRYTLQAREEVNEKLFEVVELAKISVNGWIQENFPPKSQLAYDPQLHTLSAVRSLSISCQSRKSFLAPVNPNPIDCIWQDQPSPPLSPLTPHTLQFSGQSLQEKCRQCAAHIYAAGADAAILTLADSICWLFNVRGADVEYTPVSLAYAILYKDSSAEVFIDTRKLTNKVREHLGNTVTIKPHSAFQSSLQQLSATGKKIQVDPQTASDWIFQSLGEDAHIVEHEDPCILAKAIKNTVELSGTRAAHLRDGVALTKFLYWMHKNAIKGTVTELDAATLLEEFRSHGENFRGLSFPTITGTGPNGAVVHYRADPTSNRTIEPGDLYLVDSGAQYLDGTTDVTRTIAVGTPTEEMRDRFTRVLKGHIAIATARFPSGTSGGQLDALARLSLWEAGIDFQHGTGHGVGSFLSVHEGPQRISKSLASSALKSGMIISNEPGYYKTDCYGIRIENLLVVAEATIAGDLKEEFLEFDTLTLAPIDRTLIVENMLNTREKKWLNDYHGSVHAQLARYLDSDICHWLEDVTSPI